MNLLSLLTNNGKHKVNMCRMTRAREWLQIWRVRGNKAWVQPFVHMWELVKRGRATVDRSVAGWWFWEIVFGVEEGVTLPEDLQRKVITLVW